jgi:hypothetical protein
MKRHGVAGTILVAALAFAVLCAGSASAYPSFSPLPSIKRYEATTGSTTFAAAGNTVTCERGTGLGEITGRYTVGRVVLKLSACKAKASGATCTINSVGAHEGEIVTKTLKGELGSVKSREATSEAGVFIEPETGKTWLTLAAGVCSEEVKVSGSIAGEVGPTGTLAKMGFINFEVASGRQKIQQIDVASGGAREPELDAFGETVTLDKYELIEAAEPVEIS